MTSKLEVREEEYPITLAKAHEIPVYNLALNKDGYTAYDARHKTAKNTVCDGKIPYELGLYRYYSNPESIFQVKVYCPLPGATDQPIFVLMDDNTPRFLITCEKEDVFAATHYVSSLMGNEWEDRLTPYPVVDLVAFSVEI